MCKRGHEVLNTLKLEILYQKRNKWCPEEKRTRQRVESLLFGSRGIKEEGNRQTSWNLLKTFRTKKSIVHAATIATSRKKNIKTDVIKTDQ
jgi:hypothetical protein